MTENTNEWRLKGELTFDSPGVWSQVEDLYSKEDCGSIWKAYAIAAQLGALNDWPVMRASGVSYNSRPARLMHILLTPEVNPSARILAAAALACVSQLETHPPRDGLTQEWEVALKVQVLFAPEEAGDHTIHNPDVLLVAYARILDQLRHLHMTSLARVKREEQVELLANLVSRLPPLDRARRITIQIQAALDRSQRAGRK